jgi:hypothetical protein
LHNAPPVLETEPKIVRAIWMAMLC